jgi:TRAP-type C4-dicarboxylate transport system substrate-binding protein
MVRIRPVVLLAVMAVSAGCGSSGFDKAGSTQARHPVVLTLADFNGDTGELDGFAARVARLSSGTMRINIKDRWRFGQVNYETGLIGDVRAGKAELGVVGSRAWDSVGVGSFRALAAPLLIDSYALQERVLRSPMIGQMLGGLRPLGLAGIGVLPGPLRKPLGITRRRSSPPTMRGSRSASSNRWSPARRCEPSGPRPSGSPLVGRSPGSMRPSSRSARSRAINTTESAST